MKAFFVFLFTFLFPAMLLAQKPSAPGETVLPIKPERTIEFTTDEGGWMSLDVSPDGKTIVFALLGDLYTLPIRGGEARQLTHGLALDEQPVFSPDGARIAFESDRSGTRNVWTMKADGADLRRITSETTLRRMDPLVWSADGGALLVRGHKSGESGSNIHLATIELKSGVVKRLQIRGFATAGAFTEADKAIIFSLKGSTHDKDDLFRLDLGTGEVSPLGLAQKGGNSPLVSPDGKWLSYVRRSDPSDASARDDGLQIYLHALDPNLQTKDRLLAAVRGALNYRGVGQRYAFTPDSRSLIVTDEGKFKRIDLQTGEATAIPFSAAVKAELGPLRLNKRRLTDGPLKVRAVMDVSASPDGKRFAFSSVGKVWVIDSSGVARRLTQGALDGRVREYDPVFSPDGRSIAYVTWSDQEGGKLWKISLERPGSQPVALAGDGAEGAMAYASPCWTPDGRRVAFVTAQARDWFESRFIAGEAAGIWWRVATPQRIGWVDAGGGAVRLLPAVQGDSGTEARIQPTISVIGDGGSARVFYIMNRSRSGAHPLQSIGLEAKDISDVRTHARLSMHYNELRARPSPDGRWLLIQDRFNVRLVPMPPGDGSAKDAPEIINDSGYIYGRTPTADLLHVTTGGGRYPTWSPDGQWLTWSAGNRIFRLRLREALSKQRALPRSIAVELPVTRFFGRGRLLLRNARVVTMRASGITTADTPQGPRVTTDPGVIERADILIEGRRIAAVGPAGSVKAPAGTKIMDVTGKTIIPGIMGLDDEPFDMSPMLRDLWPQYALGVRYGVTTISTHGSANYPRDELLETGQLVGPRIFGAVQEIIHPEWFWATSLEDARGVVRTHKTVLGNTRVSLYHLDHRIQSQWLTLAATLEGIDAAHHSGDNWIDLIGGVLDGNGSADHFSSYIQYGYRDAIQLYARSGTTFISTVTQSMNSDFKKDRTYPQYQLAAKYEELMLRDAATNANIARSKLRAVGAAREVLRSGGNIGLGSHSHPGWQTLANIVNLSAGGMTNAEALRCATLNGAMGLGLAQDLGSIEAGKIADLVVLNGNPLEDLRHLSDVLYTAKDGVLYEAATLDTIWPVQRRFRQEPWQSR